RRVALEAGAELAEAHQLVVADGADGLEHGVAERRGMALAVDQVVIVGSSGRDQSYCRWRLIRTAIRSAADIDEVGWPEPAAVLQRIESTRSCWPRSRRKSRSFLVGVSATAISDSISPLCASALHQHSVEAVLADGGRAVSAVGLLPRLKGTAARSVAFVCP